MKTKVMNAVDEAKKLYKQELDAGRKPVFTSIAETLFQQTGIKRTGKTISGWCKKYKWKEDYELKLDELSKSPKRKRGGQRGNKNGVSFKEYESWDIKDARSFMLKSLNWIKRSSKRINIAEFCIKEGYPSNALDFLSSKFEQLSPVYQMIKDQIQINRDKYGVSGKGNSAYVKYVDFNSNERVTTKQVVDKSKELEKLEKLSDSERQERIKKLLKKN